MKKMNNISVLDELDKGEIDLKTAINKIKKNNNKRHFIKNRHFFKIKIKSDDTKINLIFPLFLADLAVSIGLSVCKNKSIKHIQADQLIKIRQIKGKDIRQLIRQLRHCSIKHMVSVYDGSDIVNIDLL